MKNFGTLLLLICLLPNIAMAKRKYGMAGCGLGSVAFGTQNQILAYTVNTSFSQTGAITSGTSNCQGDSESEALERQQTFVATNLVTLSKELAEGGGKTVEGLASVLGCRPESLHEFEDIMQDSYTEIFRAPGASAVLDTIKYQLVDEPGLAKNCSLAMAGIEVVE